MNHPFVPGIAQADLEAIVAPLLTALAEAGRAIEDVQARREDDGIDVQRKGDGSPVTAADQASHEVLGPALAAAFPDIPVVSEEDWKPGQPIPDLAWVVDPLDGTKEFIKQNGEYVVNVGLLQDGFPVFGAVHVPATGHHFVGGPSLGAWRITDAGWDPLQAAAFQGGTLRVVASRSHRGPLVDAFLGTVEAGGVTTECIPMGSAWKLILVAEDRADAYPRLGPTMWWDTLAPQAVVEGAGGRVLDGDGARFDYRLDEGGDPRNRFFLVVGASGPHDELITAAFHDAEAGA